MPIKPIPGCIALQGDITTDKLRSDLRKELKTWKADLVLHDGAPNVGKNWIHDAYQQSVLTLHAFKLATEFLSKGGTFVTKVFRSKDYQSLMWVFNQFFKNVHATKPAASRNESAEIFVVCLKYKAPDKIDPKFLDHKHVFSEVDPLDSAKSDELVNPEKKKKAPAEGYETGQTLLFKKANASDFISEDKPIHVLNNCHEIVLDESWIRKHSKTTFEVKECCKDLRVLGMKELRLLKKWRETLKVEQEKRQKELAEKQSKKMETNGDDDQNEASESDSDEDESDMDELEKEIDNEARQEKQLEKRKKKKMLKEKRKRAVQIDLKMIHTGDEGPMRSEEGLFQIKDLKNVKDLNKINDQAPDQMVPDSDSDWDDEPKSKTRKISKDKGVIDKQGLFYKEQEVDNEDSNDESSEDDDSGKEDLDIQADEAEEVDDEQHEELNDVSNPLLVTMEPKDRESRKERKANMWFDKDIFKGIEDDEDLEEADVQGAIDAIKKKGGKMLTKKKPPVREYHSSSDEDDDEAEKENKAKRETIDGETSEDSSSEDEATNESRKRKKKGKKMILTPEELALGQEMIRSKKARRDFMDAGWNRFMFDDKDSDLPDWFVKEEQLHMRCHPDVDPKVVDFYKEKQRDVNTKTIKKVVEAKARKKRKLTKSMEKAKKKASAIMENEDIGSREKANTIQKLYKKAANSIKKKEVSYVVAKKHTAAKRAKRPAGVKGQYKQVDPRMKKDTGSKRKNATNKRLQKRRLKGKKTKPQNLPQN